MSVSEESGWLVMERNMVVTGTVSHHTLITFIHYLRIAANDGVLIDRFIPFSTSIINSRDHVIPSPSHSFQPKILRLPTITLSAPCESTWGGNDRSSTNTESFGEVLV